MDWLSWHEDYDQPGTNLSRRLVLVREQISEALDALPEGPIRVISACAGQGRDLLGVLADHPRRDDVRAFLVELDERNVQLARRGAPPKVTVSNADASLMASYDGWAPADLVLMCGVFGNITDEDVENTIAACQQLTAPGGTVIWTRHRYAPDLVPWICDRFGAYGFEQVWVSGPEVTYGVGAHRFTGTPQPLDLDRRMFTFLERSGRV